LRTPLFLPWLESGCFTRFKEMRERVRR
jgi:hypothetical protein